jgi:hypothetical protein
VAFTEFGEAALRYARLGLAVIPLEAGRKKPIFDKWTSIARADVPLIRKWWTQTPNANVGILTGAISRCFVVDVDAKNGGLETYETLIHKHGRFPDTWQDMTGGIGGGFHLYFRYPAFEVRNAVGIFQGIDVRGDGGQVVAPPSVHPDTGRRYEWDGLKEIENTPMADAPLWLIDVLHGKSDRKVSDKFPIEQKIPKGVQHMTLVSLAGKLRQLGLNADEIYPSLIAVHDKRCAEPGPKENVRTIADSMMRYQPADKQLIAVANKLWRIAKTKDLEQQEEDAKRQINVVDGLTVYRSPVAEQHCVVEGILYNGLTIFAGRPKIGKSWVALQLALSVSQGRLFLDARTVHRPGSVLYAALEESQTRTSGRMQKLQPNETVLLENISMLYQLAPLTAGGREQLEERIKKHNPTLVIVDTFLALVGLGTNKRDVLRGEYAEMKILHDIAERHGTALVVVHHMRKPVVGSKGLDAVAGSTGLTAAADSVWTMERSEGDLCSIDIHGRDTEDQTLALKFEKGESFGWKLVGTGEYVKDTQDEAQIFALLRSEGSLKAGKIATLLRLNANRVRTLLYSMTLRGDVLKQHGSFVLPREEQEK